MADSPSSILLLRLQSTGSNVNLWGGYLNTALQTLEQASKGYQSLAVTGDATISWTNYATGNTGQAAHLKLTGSLSAAAALTFPSYQNRLLVSNTTGQSVTIKCSGGTGVTIPNNRKAMIRCDGTDYDWDTAFYTGASYTLTNNGDFVTYQQLSAAIAVLAGAITGGLVLNSATDPGAGYLTTKLAIASADDLLLASLATTNAGTASEKTTATFSARRVLRRALFAGQV